MDETEDGMWLLDLLQDEAREHIERCQSSGEEISLMGFLNDFNRKCNEERVDKDGVTW